jgi:hypothetical protein
MGGRILVFILSDYANKTHKNDLLANLKEKSSNKGSPYIVSASPVYATTRILDIVFAVAHCKFLTGQYQI